MDSAPFGEYKGGVEPPEGSLLKQEFASDRAKDLAHILSKTGNGTDQSFLDVPLQSAFDASTDSLSHYSSNLNNNSNQYPATYSYTAASAGTSPRSPSPAPPKTWRSRASNAWQENKGVVLMILAQFFGSAMTATARLLETDVTEGPPMSPFQILFARQGVTVVFSLLYMWWAKVPEAPLGPKAVRPILLLRGFGGFFGVFGLYYSVIYLPLADATVMTFLAPMLAAWICSWIIKTSFTRSQKIGGLVSILGVILITRPFTLFYSLTSSDLSTTASNSTLVDLSPISSSNATANSTSLPTLPTATPAQRAIAVVVALVGVLGAATAYTTISWIGKRAHPLISVNYFATWCTLISTICLAFIPSIPFRLPATNREWLLLLSLGLSGFVMQFLLTASLAHRRSNRVLNIVYVQMVFALGFDKLIWDETPGWVSVVGSGMILGSVIWVAVKRDRGDKEGRKPDVDEERRGAALPEEQQGLVGHAEGEFDEEEQTEEDGEYTLIDPPALETGGERGHKEVEMQELHR